MSGYTARTQAYLLGSEFQDFQPPGAIGPGDCRDLIGSMPMPNIIQAPFRPNFPPYNAKFDGASNDTTAWTTMFSDIATRGYGEVLMPGGTSLVNPSTLNIPTSCTIRGQGRGASILSRFGSSAGWILQATGSTGTPLTGVGLQDFAITGGTIVNGGLFRMYYGVNATVERMFLSNTNDFAVQMVQVWDSVLQNCAMETCGMNNTGNANTIVDNQPGVIVGSEVIQIIGGTAASGVGASADNNNHIKIRDCSISVFCAGAITIAKGYSGTSPTAYEILIENMHIEAGGPSPPVFTGFSLIGIDGPVNAVVVRKCFLAADGTAAGSGADNRGSMVCIYCGSNASSNVFENINYNIPATSFQAVIRGYAGGWRANRVFPSGPADPTAAVLYSDVGNPLWSEIFSEGVALVYPPTAPKVY